MQIRSAALCRLALDRDVHFILYIPCYPVNESEATRLDEVRALAGDPRTMKTYSHGSYYIISNVAIDSARVPPPMLGPRFIQALHSAQKHATTITPLASEVAAPTPPSMSHAEGDDSTSSNLVPEASSTGLIKDVVPRVLFHAPLKPHADVQRELENTRAYGGMRNPQDCC